MSTVPSYDPTPPPPDTEPRRWWGRHLQEVRWQAELARLLVDPVFAGREVPYGDSGPVMLIPGFLAGDASLGVMGSWLRRIGHRPHQSGILVNVDCSDRALDTSKAGPRASPPAAAGGSRSLATAAAGTSPRRSPTGVPTSSSASSRSARALDTPFDISLPTQAAVRAVRWVHVRTTDRVARNGCFTDTCRCRFARDYAAAFPAESPSRRSTHARTASSGGRRAACPTPATWRSPAATSGWPSIARPTARSPRRSPYGP